MGKYPPRWMGRDLIEAMKIGATQSGVMRETYDDAHVRIFVLDYDGTLSNHVDDPEMAMPRPELIHTLTVLCEDPKNKAYIVSGRDQKFLEDKIGVKVPKMGLSCLHGCLFRQPGEPWKTDVNFGHLETWVHEAATIMKDQRTELKNATHTEPKKLEEKMASVIFPDKGMETTLMAVAFHYDQGSPVESHIAAELLRKLKALKAKTRTEAGQTEAFKIVEGKNVIEAHPFGPDKGVVVERIINHWKKETGARPGFCLGAGDDTTDTDMFWAIDEAYSLRQRGLDGRAGRGRHERLAGPALIAEQERRREMSKKEIVDDFMKRERIAQKTGAWVIRVGNEKIVECWSYEVDRPEYLIGILMGLAQIYPPNAPDTHLALGRSQIRRVHAYNRFQVTGRADGRTLVEA